MATGVLILVKTNCEISEEDLASLRERFIEEMGLCMEDFYYQGPLVHISNKENEFIPLADSHCWLNVNFYRAFYHPEYPRGDIRLYVRTAEWLEKAIPGSEIYYGNDTGGDSIILFDEQKRREFPKPF